MAKLKFKIVPVPPPPGSADLRLVPDLKRWYESTKEMILRLGFTYELRAEDGTLITDEEGLDGYDIVEQTPVAGTISKTGDLLVLKLVEHVDE
jgi:hypothetical protein